MPSQLRPSQLGSTQLVGGRGGIGNGSSAGGGRGGVGNGSGPFGGGGSPCNGACGGECVDDNVVQLPSQLRPTQLRSSELVGGDGGDGNRSRHGGSGGSFNNGTGPFGGGGSPCNGTCVSEGGDGNVELVAVVLVGGELKTALDSSPCWGQRTGSGGGRFKQSRLCAIEQNFHGRTGAFGNPW